MRLLNTSSLQLREFWDKDVPPYAILSHTWEEEEVSFLDMQGGKATNKVGYAKIVGSCSQAAGAGLSYIWIDTCCIDKSSSAELTEAINSMYRWYSNADVCYAFLWDVSVSRDGNMDSSAFAKSRWFTRGWTLQELIAPLHVTFYSRDWKAVGTKAQLTAQISEITGIDVGTLKGETPQCASVAARMFWASQRVSTRVEDIAYCLMGLFDVNMPLLYGEGEKAFIRLQEEIMKTSDDHSIFAWKERKTPRYLAGKPISGLLARSPTSFGNSKNIIRTQKHANHIPFAITNRGLRIELALVPKKADDNELSIAVLDCVDGRDRHSPLGIQVRHLSASEGGQFVRTSCDTLFTVTLENWSSEGARLYSQILYVPQRLQRQRLFKEDVNGDLHFMYEKISAERGETAEPVYRSLPPEGRPSWSFALDFVPPFKRWTPVS